MYHYKNNLFVQNRLYPQGNDGATDLYEKFRGFVIEEFCPLLDVDENWCAHQGTNGFVYSEGVHYRDYGNNIKCGVFYPKSRADDAQNQKITIGHEGICIKCGRSYSNTYNYSHDRCTSF
jgi:hypothetical protein